MGILANNEWREGWLDEGFTEYQAALFEEAKSGGPGRLDAEQFLLGMQLDDYAQPYSMTSNEYNDFFTYNMSVYSGGELFLHRLQYVVGDSVMQAALRQYYDQWKLRHVNEDRFRAVVEETSKQPLGPFFAQQLHGVDLTDYAVGRISKTHSADSAWVTRVEVLRKAPRQIPVEVQVIGATDTATVRSGGAADREWVVVRTKSEPRSVTLDPRVQTGDWNFLDNHKAFGAFPNPARVEPYLDTYFSTRTARDHLTMGLAPEVWYNDAGGVTVGLRSRTDYLGRFDQNILSLTSGTGWGADDPVYRFDVFARIKNPTTLRAPNMSQVFEGFSMEGRAGATIAFEKKRRAHMTSGPTVTQGLSFRWVTTTEMAFLDPGFYQDAGTIEATIYGGASNRSRELAARPRLRRSRGGVVYDNEGPGVSTENRYDTQGYLRWSVVGTARRPLGKKMNLAFRGFAGMALADGSARQAAAGVPGRRRPVPEPLQSVPALGGRPAGAARGVLPGAGRRQPPRLRPARQLAAGLLAERAARPDAGHPARREALQPGEHQRLGRHCARRPPLGLGGIRPAPRLRRRRARHQRLAPDRQHLVRDPLRRADLGEPGRARAGHRSVRHGGLPVAVQLRAGHLGEAGATR